MVPLGRIYLGVPLKREAIILEDKMTLGEDMTLKESMTLREITYT